MGYFGWAPSLQPELQTYNNPTNRTIGPTLCSKVITGRTSSVNRRSTLAARGISFRTTGQEEVVTDDGTRSRGMLGRVSPNPGRLSRTALSRSSDPPRILSPSGGGSCVCSLAVGGGTHVSSAGGSAPPNAAVGELRCSAHVRFVINFSTFLALFPSFQRVFFKNRYRYR